MSTIITIKRLEKKFREKITHKKFLVCQNISLDGRWMDDDGYLLSDDEIKKIYKQHDEARKNGGTLILKTTYSKPKIRG